jgi:molybdenum cofactor cytidylyltransferase
VRSFDDFACTKIIAVLNNRGYELLNESSMMLPPNFRAVINQHPEKGRFFSLQTGLALLGNEDFVFVHNADNPFVSSEVLAVLLENIHSSNFIYPTYKGKGGHPLLISRGTAVAIAAEHNSGVSLKDFLKKFHGSAIEIDFPEMLVNINTQEDYRKYFAENHSQPDSSIFR